MILELKLKSFCMCTTVIKREKARVCVTANASLAFCLLSVKKRLFKDQTMIRKI